LYTHPETGLVFAPGPEEPSEILRGQPGGVLPRVKNIPIASFSESKEIRKSLKDFFQMPLRGKQ
jgi:hypothetical protein